MLFKGGTHFKFKPSEPRNRSVPLVLPVRMEIFDISSTVPKNFLSRRSMMGESDHLSGSQKIHLP